MFSRFSAKFSIIFNSFIYVVHCIAPTQDTAKLNFAASLAHLRHLLLRQVNLNTQPYQYSGYCYRTTLIQSAAVAGSANAIFNVRPLLCVSLCGRTLSIHCICLYQGKPYVSAIKCQQQKFVPIGGARPTISKIVNLVPSWCLVLPFYCFAFSRLPICDIISTIVPK